MHDVDVPNEAEHRRVAAIAEADRILIRYGLPSYTRLAAERAVAGSGLDSAFQVRSLELLHARYEHQLLALRASVRIGSREVQDAIRLADSGDVGAALDRLDELVATMRKQAGPVPPGRDGTINFQAWREALAGRRRARNGGRS